MVLSRLRAGLQRTRNRISHALRRLGGDTSLEEALEALEEILYTADVGLLAGEILDELQDEVRRGTIARADELGPWLRERLLRELQDPGPEPLRLHPSGPTVILVVGVNGSGKTTSVARLVAWLQGRGLKVLLGAADTYRAAAVEQLGIWADRLGVDLVTGPHQGDPAAVAHDAAEAALARGADVLVVDTAGRLHTQKNLMEELAKVARVLGRKIPGAPHETLLVLDATTGQNAVQQARRFAEKVPVDGIFLAKLDGTAKGGAVFAVQRELGLPVKFVGLGEGLEDLEVFDPGEFTDALLGPRPAAETA